MEDSRHANNLSSFPSCIQICTLMECLDDTDKWDTVVICYRRISETCFHISSIPITGFPMCGMCGMFEVQFHFQSQCQFAEVYIHTTADGTYQRPSYTVAGGVLFQLLTCTTAGTRSIVTVLPQLGSSTRQ